MFSIGTAVVGFCLNSPDSKEVADGLFIQILRIFPVWRGKFFKIAESSLSIKIARKSNDCIALCTNHLEMYRLTYRKKLLNL